MGQHLPRAQCRQRLKVLGWEKQGMDEATHKENWGRVCDGDQLHQEVTEETRGSKGAKDFNPKEHT